MTASARVPTCGIYWGSLEKTGTSVGGWYWWSYPVDRSGVVNVRAGRHDCFDRMVIDVNGIAPGYWVRYVDKIVQYPHVDGLRATADPGPRQRLPEITAPSAAGDSAGRDPFLRTDRNHLVDVNGSSTFRQIIEVNGAYETFRLFGLGVRARLPFRVFALTGPGNHSRLVIDVAHRW